MSNPIERMVHMKNRLGLDFIETVTIDDEFFRKILGPPCADPFTLDFSSGPVASCSCPEKKLKKLYNYIDQESSRYAQSNIRSLYIYADLLGKAVHILGVIEFTL